MSRCVTHLLVFSTGILMMYAAAATAQLNGNAAFFNCTIHTLDANARTGAAMLVRNGRIALVGDEAEVLEAASGVVKVDLQGKHVFPAFIDAHGHLYGYGEETRILMLQGTASKDDVLSRVIKHARDARHGAWIRGRGWDQNDWPAKVFPHRRDLDLAAPNHPVFLSRIDGHAAWVNSAALALAGITKSTPDPNGGRILRDADGEPNGILMDNAVDLVKSKISLPNREETAAIFRSGIDRCLALGLGGMHDMGLSAEHLEALTLLVEKGDFPFRLAGYIDGRCDAWEQLLARGRTVLGDDQVTLAGLKLYADGALGSRGALLLEDYSDEAGNKGISITSPDSITFEAVRAMRKDLQVCVHAIGDGGNRLTLDAYERALGTRDVAPRLPLRVEHVQVLAPEDIPRFARLGIIPSMQPIHCTSDMYWAESRLGARRVRGAYAWRSLIDAGSWIPAGSDCPVERPDPLWGIYAACTRQDHDGRPAHAQDIVDYFNHGVEKAVRAEQFNEGWYAEQRMTRSEAIKAYTIWAARAVGLDDRLGSLEPGKYADFVLLSSNISIVPSIELLQTRVLRTYISGVEVFKATQ